MGIDSVVRRSTDPGGSDEGQQEGLSALRAHGKDKHDSPADWGLRGKALRTGLLALGYCSLVSSSHFQ